jgi:hypothetical protein
MHLSSIGAEMLKVTRRCGHAGAITCEPRKDGALGISLLWLPRPPIMAERGEAAMPNGIRTYRPIFRLWPRLCENSTRYIRTRNFEPCGYARSQKTQKFALRSALGPNHTAWAHGRRGGRRSFRGSHQRRSGPPIVPAFMLCPRCRISVSQ